MGGDREVEGGQEERTVSDGTSGGKSWEGF